MNSNRQVLRPTHNRLPLHDVVAEKPSIFARAKICTNSSSQQQQENIVSIGSRPILTATRSIKKLLKENHDDNRMFLSPLVSAINKASIVTLPKQSIAEENKTREQLEQELLEL